MMRMAVSVSLSIIYAAVVFTLSIQNMLGDSLVQLYVGTIVLAGASIKLLDFNAVESGILWAFGTGACLIGMAVATHINGYNDPPVFSGLGLIVMSAYLILPTAIIWLSVYFSATLIRNNIKKSNM